MKKSTKIWVTLLVGPYVLLVLCALIFAYQITTPASELEATFWGKSLDTVIISIGSTAVGCILLSPIWLIVLMRNVQYNNIQKAKAFEEQRRRRLAEKAAASKAEVKIDSEEEY